MLMRLISSKRTPGNLVWGQSVASGGFPLTTLCFLLNRTIKNPLCLLEEISVPGIHMPLQWQLALSRNTEGNVIPKLTTSRGPRFLHQNHPPDRQEVRGKHGKRSTHLNSFTQILFFKLQKPETNQTSVQSNTDPIPDDTEGVNIYLRAQQRDGNNPRIKLMV